MLVHSDIWPAAALVEKLPKFIEDTVLGADSLNDILAAIERNG